MHFIRPLVSLTLLATLAGCGRATSPAMPVTPSAPLAPPAAAEAPIEVPVEPAAIITSHTGRALPTVSMVRAAIADEDDPPALAAYMAAEDPPSYNVDDRTPYNVVIAEKSAHTTAIAWHTEVPTKGIIEYGRAWGFDKNGFTHKFTDDVAKTDHQITLTELRRWTGYVYRVTAVSPLGLKFPEQERKFRTKFWSWR